MVNLENTTISGERLKWAREAAGFTQEEAAQRVGINKQTISSYECDRGVPSGNVLLRLCLAYRIDPAALVKTN